MQSSYSFKSHKKLRGDKANREEQIALDKAEANQVKKVLEGEVIKLKTKVGEGGKLFGSITSMDIANAIKEQTKLRCRQEENSAD